MLIGFAAAVIAFCLYIAARPTQEQIAARARKTAAETLASINASMRSDLRRMEAAEEAFFQRAHTYATFEQLFASGARPSSGNTIVIVPAATGYTATVSNAAIGLGISPCVVQVGAGASSTVDGVFFCGGAKGAR